MKSDVRAAFNLVESVQTIKIIHLLCDLCINCFIEVSGILILKIPKMTVVHLTLSCQSGWKASNECK